MACNCRHLDAMFVCHRCCAVFICVMVSQSSKVYLMNDNISNQWMSICYSIRIIGILFIIVISNV